MPLTADPSMALTGPVALSYILAVPQNLPSLGGTAVNQGTPYSSTIGGPSYQALQQTPWWAVPFTGGEGSPGGGYGGGGGLAQLPPGIGDISQLPQQTVQAAGDAVGGFWRERGATISVFLLGIGLLGAAALGVALSSGKIPVPV